MKIVLTCGHPESGLNAIHQLLTTAGLKDAKPSPRKMLSPAELHSAIFAALASAHEAGGALAQLVPDRELQEVAVDLFLGNAGHASWGWADTRSVWLLEFWRNFDPQVRFLLVYSAPEIAIGHMLRRSPNLAVALEQMIGTWMASCTEMLRFYHRNRERCLLVNNHAALGEPARVIQEISDTFGLELNKKAQEKKAQESSAVRPEYPAIASVLARSLLDGRDEVFSLYRELESSADLEYATSHIAGTEPRTAWHEYTGLLEALAAAPGDRDQLKADFERLRVERTEIEHQLKANVERLRDERTEIELQLARADEENLRLGEAIKRADAVTLETAAKLQQLQSMNEGLARDRQLHELQLKQVQEELSLYSSKAQELSQSQQSCMAELATRRRFWLEHQPGELILDLRKDIDGENWYYPEKDGRWAGPGQVSTLRLPCLRNGRYKIQIDVVDAMEPEILAGLEVNLNGSPLVLKHQGRRYPIRVSSQFTADEFSAIPVWQFQLKSPKLVCPANHGSADQRMLSIRVLTVTLSKLD